LRVCDDIAPPLTLDPQKQFTEKNHTLLQQIYEGLVRFDADGKIVPLLATSWKRIDPLTMEFHLREGVRFHNGEAFDAESVKFSIERYLDPKTGFPAAGFIRSLRGVEIVDPHTVRVKTFFPDGLLLNRLAGFILIVPKNYCRQNGTEILSQRPVGTGPFRFQNWLPGHAGINMDANPTYWDPERPKVGKLTFFFIPANKQVEALLKDRVDILTNLPGTQTIEIQKNADTYVLKKPTFYTVSASFKILQNPLLNKRVRVAMNLAVNKAELIRYDLMGNGRPIAAMSLPGQFGHNPNVRPYPFDLTQARRILAEEGYQDGFTLNVLVKADGLRTAQIIAKHLSRLKIKLLFTVITDAELIPSLQKKDRWDMVLGDCPDPLYHSYFIPAVFLYSKSPFSLCANPEFDRRLESMIVEIDSDKQRKLAEDLDRFIHDEALGLFCYQQIRTYGLRKKIHFEPSKSGMHYFDRAYRE
jgi:peptide/nickel transport system substrate-binding protein